MRSWRAAALLLAAGAAGADHITDRLAVGLHDSPNDENPRRLLVSGTPVEILDRAGRLCKVALGDGDKGWLECRYVTSEKPARAMLLDSQARIAELRRHISELESAGPTPPSAAPAPVAGPPGLGLGGVFAALVAGVLLGSAVSYWLLRKQ